jgi:hypothetical protein
MKGETKTTTASTAPETLKQISKLLADLKNLCHMDREAWEQKYVTPEGRTALTTWREISALCSRAYHDAYDSFPIPRMTIADGLPAEYAELEIARDMAKAMHEEWDGPFDRLHTLAYEPTWFEKGSEIFCKGGRLSQLALQARDKVAQGRSATYLVLSEIEARMKPKEREGGRVYLSRQAFYRDVDSQRDKAAKAAYDAVYDRLGGAAAEAKADEVTAAADKLQLADEEALAKQLERLLVTYLLEK